MHFHVFIATRSVDLESLDREGEDGHVAS